MRLSLIILCLLLVACGAYAGVGTPRSIGAVTQSGSGMAFLQIPRYNCGISGDTMIIMPAQSGTNQTGYLVSTNKGGAWTEYVTQMGYATNWGRSWYPTDHMSIWVAGGLHYTNRVATSGYPGYYKYWDGPYTVSDSEKCDTLLPYVYYPIVAATSATDVWYANLTADTADLLEVLHTNDRFATDTTRYFVCKPACNGTTQNSYRVGMVLDSNNYPVIVSFLYGVSPSADRGFYRHKFNGTGFDSLKIHTATHFTGSDRNFAHAQVNGKTHLVYFDYQNNDIIHWFETEPGVFDSTIAAATTVASWAGPQLTVYGSPPNQCLYMGAIVRDAADTTFFTKVWTEYGGWGDSLEIADGYCAHSFAIPPHVPDTWDSIPVAWHNRDCSNDIYFTQFSAKDLLVTIRGYTYPYKDTITSFPFTATQNRTAYVLTQDHNVEMQSTGAIYFNDCDTCALVSEGSAKYTLYADTNGTDVQRGIYNQGSQYFNMKRIRVVAVWDMHDTIPESCFLVFDENNRYGHYDSCYFYSTGYTDASGSLGDDWYDGLHTFVGSAGSGGNLDGVLMNEMHACSTIMDGNGFPDRHIYPQAAVYLRLAAVHDTVYSADPNPAEEWGWRVDSSFIYSNWGGIFCIGTYWTAGGVFNIEGNDIVSAYRNTSQENYSGSFVGDGGGIQLIFTEKFYVVGNVVTAVWDTTLGADTIWGGTGGFVSHITDNANLGTTYRSTYAYNDVSGVCIKSTDHGTALFVKYGVYDVDFHHNIIRGTLTNIGESTGMAAWLSHMFNCTFHDNTIISVTEHDSYTMYGLRLRGIDGDTNQFYNNAIYSNDYHIWFDGDQDWSQTEGIRDMVLVDHTFGRVDTASTMSGNGMRGPHVNGWPATNNNFVNAAVTGTAIDTLISITHNGAQDYEWFRDVEVNITDEDENPINARLVVVNNYGDTIYDSNVGPDGTDSVRVKYWRRAYGGTDSTGFNPVTFTASYGEETRDSTFSVGAGSGHTVTLQYGEVEPPEPPVGNRRSRAQRTGDSQ